MTNFLIRFGSGSDPTSAHCPGCFSNNITFIALLIWFHSYNYYWDAGAEEYADDVYGFFEGKYATDGY